MSLLRIETEMGVDAFELMRDFTPGKTELLAEYGYTLEDDIRGKFDFKVSRKGVQLVKLDATIQKVRGNSSWEALKKAVLSPKIKEFVVVPEVGTRQEEDRVPLFVFWPKSPESIVDFGFGVCSARYNAKTGKPVSIKSYSGSRSYYYGRDEILTMSEAEQRIDQLVRNWDDQLQKMFHSRGWYLNTYHTTREINAEQLKEIRKYIGGQIELIFKDLSDRSLYIAQDGHFSTAGQLTKVKLEKEPAGLFFELNEEDEFITLEPYVEVRGQNPLPLRQFTAFACFWMLVHPDNILFRWGTGANAEMVSYFRRNGFRLRVKKDFSEGFIRDFVLPVREQFDIIFKTSQPVVEEPLSLVCSRLYLKEDDAHLLVVPQYVYRDGRGNETEELYDGLLSRAQYADGRIIIQERNAEAEAGVWTWLESQHPGFAAQSGNPFFYVPFGEVMKGNWLLNFLDAAEEQHCEVLGFKDLKKMKFSPYRGKISMRASSGIDWFDMRVEISFGDQVVSLTEARKAILKKENYIQLKDGTLGMLPEEWVRKLESLFKIGRVSGEEIHLSKLHFSLIDELISEIDHEEVYRELQEKKKKLLYFDRMPAVSPLPKVNATLRHYQQEGLKWLNFLDEFGWGGCLADDMGLGKTLQVLTFLQQQKLKSRGTHLVVVPTSLIFNWQVEAEKFTPDLKLFVYRGVARRRDTAFFKGYDIILTTYGTMRSDVELLRTFQFHYVVLDEAQAIKNPGSQLSKAARLLKAVNRITMTGTPVENNTFDLYAQFDFLNPGMLGSADFFRNEYANPIDKHQDKAASDQLRKLVYPFMLKRTKEEVATDLPDKTETVIFCEMGKKQRKIYDAFREKYRMEIAEKMETEGLGKAGFLVLEGLLKLRQICDSPAILPGDEDFGDESVKLEEITREIEENASNHKILIFSQFLGMLDLIKQYLEKIKISYEYLDGQTTDRADRVNRFQSDQTCRVFLMSLKAGGVGLNLTGADYVYLIDPWWNPAVERQAIDRTHRIGQTRKVFAYRMICKDTIEEKILLLQQRKKELADDLAGSETGFIKKLTRDDIMGLFS